MQIGQKLRALREEKCLAQGYIQHKTGLFRCYVSRVENGFTVPSVEALEKFSRALEISLYRFFTDGERIDPRKLSTIPKGSELELLGLLTIAAPFSTTAATVAGAFATEKLRRVHLLLAPSSSQMTLAFDRFEKSRHSH